MVLRKVIRNRKIKKLFQPHSGRNDMNEAILIHFGSNKAILILFLAKLRKLKGTFQLKSKFSLKCAKICPIMLDIFLFF